MKKLTAAFMTACIIASQCSFPAANTYSAAPVADKIGDINGDSSVDASDASFALTLYAQDSTGQVAKPTAEELETGDVNGDGSVDATDASLILGYYSYVQTATGIIKPAREWFSGGNGEVSEAFSETVYLYFSSGVGAWCTELNIEPDGTFEGYFLDMNMGESYTEFGGGTGVYYECKFTGKFKDPVKVNDYEYAMTLDYISYDIGEPYLYDESDCKMLIIPTEPYGMEIGTEYMLYTPGALTSVLPEEFLDREYCRGKLFLSGYGLYNVEGKYAFLGHDSRFFFNGTVSEDSGDYYLNFENPIFGTVGSDEDGYEWTEIRKFRLGESQVDLADYIGKPALFSLLYGYDCEFDDLPVLDVMNCLDRVNLVYTMDREEYREMNRSFNAVSWYMPFEAICSNDYGYITYDKMSYILRTGKEYYREGGIGTYMTKEDVEKLAKEYFGVEWVYHNQFAETYFPSANIEWTYQPSADIYEIVQVDGNGMAGDMWCNVSELIDNKNGTYSAVIDRYLAEPGKAPQNCYDRIFDWKLLPSQAIINSPDIYNNFNNIRRVARDTVLFRIVDGEWEVLTINGFLPINI